MKVYYLPGIPEVFQRNFQIQIAHLVPENITLYGEGIFPRISLDLHRNLQGNEKYEHFLEQAKKNVEKEYTKYEAVDQYEVMAEELPEEETAEISAHVQMEVERLIVQDYALEHQRSISNNTEDIYFSQRSCRKLTK